MGVMPASKRCAVPSASPHHARLARCPCAPPCGTVGGSVHVEVERGGKPLAADVRVQDLQTGSDPLAWVALLWMLWSSASHVTACAPLPAAL